jgi:hypothetical protein
VTDFLELRDIRPRIKDREQKQKTKKQVDKVRQHKGQIQEDGHCC